MTNRLAQGHLHVLALWLTGAVACAAAASSPPVTAAAAPSGDIASHPSFSFGFSEMPPFGFADSARTFEVQRRVQGLIRAALVGKGYVEDPSNGALVVRFGVSNAHEVEVTTEEGGHPAQDWGRLEVDAYDAASKLQVWRSVVVAQINPSQIDDRLVANAVQHALAAFPSHANDVGSTAPQAAGAPRTAN